MPRTSLAMRKAMAAGKNIYTVKSVPLPVKKYVKREIKKNVENKMIVWNAAAQFNFLTTAWTELDVSAIGQGTGLIQRVGRQVKLQSLEINMLLDRVDATQTFRVIIGLYSGQVVTPLQTAGVTMNTVVTRNNQNGLIKKYLDKYIVCDATQRSIANFKYYKYYKRPIQITWAQDAAQPDKKLIVSIISDSGAAAHPFSSYGRLVLRFEDA